jgi:hypothetical protein
MAMHEGGGEAEGGAVPCRSLVPGEKAQQFMGGLAADRDPAHVEHPAMLAPSADVGNAEQSVRAPASGVTAQPCRSRSSRIDGAA